MVLVKIREIRGRRCLARRRGFQHGEDTGCNGPGDVRWNQQVEDTGWSERAGTVGTTAGTGLGMSTGTVTAFSGRYERENGDLCFSFLKEIRVD